MNFNSGERQMGNYINDEPIGKHVILKNNSKIKIFNF